MAKKKLPEKQYRVQGFATYAISAILYATSEEDALAKFEGMAFSEMKIGNGGAGIEADTAEEIVEKPSPSDGEAKTL